MKNIPLITFWFTWSDNHEWNYFFLFPLPGQVSILWVEFLLIEIVKTWKVEVRVCKSSMKCIWWSESMLVQVLRNPSKTNRLILLSLIHRKADLNPSPYPCLLRTLHMNISSGRPWSSVLGTVPLPVVCPYSPNTCLSSSSPAAPGRSILLPRMRMGQLLSCSSVSRDSSSTLLSPNLALSQLSTKNTMASTAGK